jgi:Outer membrane protein beta-barrel domain
MDPMRSLLSVFACFGLLAGLAGPVTAGQREDSDEEDYWPRLEIMPFAGYRVGGSFDYEDAAVSHALDLGDDSSWGIDLGLYRDRSSFYELLYSQQRAQLDTRGTSLGSLELRTEYAHFGGTLLFPDQNWFVPYLSLTMGVTKFDPQDDALVSESNFSMSLGGGMRLPINRHLAVSLGVRGYLTFIDSSSQIFCVSSGGAACLFRITASSFFQAEGQVGFVMTY